MTEPVITARIQLPLDPDRILRAVKPPEDNRAEVIKVQHFRRFVDMLQKGELRVPHMGH